MDRVMNIVLGCVISCYCFASYAQNIESTLWNKHLRDLLMDYTIMPNSEYLDNEYNMTNERMSIIPIVRSSGNIHSNFYSALFDGAKRRYDDSWNNVFGGIPCAIECKLGDVVTIIFDYLPNYMAHIGPYAKWNNEIHKNAIFDDYNTFLISETDCVCIGDGLIYMAPDYCSVAIKNENIDGFLFPFLRSWYKCENQSSINADFTLHIQRYGKIAKLDFIVEEGAVFDFNDEDGLLKYNLLNKVKIEAVDTYGNFVPIINGLVTQWNVDKDAKTATFKPLLYPFSTPFIGDDYEYGSNKSLGVTGESVESVTNYCALEATDPSMLVLRFGANNPTKVVSKPERSNIISRAYPNPTDGVFTLDTNGQGVCEVKILDLQGMVVKTVSSDGPIVRVDISGVPSGMYFYSVSQNGNISFGNIIKK